MELKDKKEEKEGVKVMKVVLKERKIFFKYDR